ncbi:MAG: hypothetical protein J6P13_02980 [Kiritimatiellae bacterium]|nr:hypothetical protein [Kiritimatiellia bacterium]
MNGEIHRYRRNGVWDYSKGMGLFVTIATEPRRPLFGKVAQGKVIHSALGKIVLESLEAMPRYNPGISLFAHVVMPDHVHFNCHIAPGLKEPLKAFGKAISRFKNYTTKQAKLMGLVGRSPTIATHGAPLPYLDGQAVPGQAYLDGQAALGQAYLDGQAALGQAYLDGQAVLGQAQIQAVPGLLWQQGCHDWLCPNRAKIVATSRYITYNPQKWELMYGCDRRLRIIEPLDSPRLDAADYWKGVGNIALLKPDSPMVSLRVSRRVRDISAIVQRMESAVAKGYTIISGFISPGERAVLAMLLNHPNAHFIRMRPSCIPNVRFRPESAYIDAFMDERYLEIARGNDETEFGRAACLDLNEEIVNIATACKGLAIYFTERGLKVIRRGEE